MEEQRFRVYFQDECPKIGAGWRIVITRIGYKYVHLKAPHSLQGTKIRRQVWDGLKKDESYGTRI